MTYIHNYDTVRYHSTTVQYHNTIIRYDIILYDTGKALYVVPYGTLYVVRCTLYIRALEQFKKIKIFTIINLL